MRFFIVFGWGSNTLSGRAMTDRGLSEAKALTYNGVLVEVHICDVDLQTYVLAHDYEYQNRSNEPEPASWVDEGSSFSVAKGWVPHPPPVIRIGKDISIKQYLREHEGHG